MLLVLGPSGAGKSTLLRCLNRFQPLNTGTIEFQGTNVDQFDVSNLRRRIGMVFQTPTLFRGTVQDNIAKGPALRGEVVSKNDLEQLATNVGLDQEVLLRDAETLSVGEKQRVSFAQTLANHPEVLLLDEPTSALDPSAVFTIEKLIQKIHREMNRTIVMVTHNVEQALRLNTRTLILLEGKVIANGPIKELIADQTSETLMRFFEGRLNGEGESSGI